MKTGKPPLYLGWREDHEVLFDGEGSLLTVGPPGTGKSRGVAVWNLLRYPGSLIVTDPKGQLTQWSADLREDEFSARIVVLDPFKITGRPSASINPLASLLQAVDAGTGIKSEAQRIAQKLLPDLKEVKDPYWRQNGRKLLTTGMLYLAFKEPAHCDLPNLHHLLWLSEAEFTRNVVNPMKESETALLRQYGADAEEMIVKREKHFGSFREEARGAVEIFAAGEPCGEASRRSEVDFAELLTGNMSVYLVLPPQFVASHGRWMGLITAHAMHTLMAAPDQGEVLALLDEFPNLGPLPAVRDSIAQLREKGLRVWIFIQDMAQLDSVYGKEDALAMRRQAEVLQILGCENEELAAYVEKRAGEETLKTTSWKMPGPLEPAGMPEQQLGETGFPVMPAAWVMGMPPGEQILIRRGAPVIVAEVTLWDGKAKAPKPAQPPPQPGPLSHLRGLLPSRGRGSSHWFSGYLRTGFLIGAAALLFAMIIGVPHLLTTYEYHGGRSAPRYIRCDYIGPFGVIRAEPGRDVSENCPIIAFF